MEENSISPVAEIPPLEENMIIDNEPAPVVDDYAATLAEYKKEMMQNGLQDSDVDYLLSEYQNLEKVKVVKMHCTSCDKHIGTAPNELQNRYEHPLLKVLVCAKCFQFYSSGEFEKDEDGSELYCRWCGEGGQVFCCSKCPFVFCKRCITRNLGRSMAKIISCSDNWVCFACDPSSISRFRASYWAVQKYATIMHQKAEENGNKEILTIDGNMCCLGVKRRIHPTLEQILNKKPRQYEKKSEHWRTVISEQPEDEVICTPDILPFEPLDESPAESPIPVESTSPVMPLVQPEIPPPLPVLQQMPPLIIRPPMTKLSLTELQNQMQQRYTQILLTPRPKPRFPTITNKQRVFIQKNPPILPKASAPNNGTFKYVLKQKRVVPNVVNTNFTIASVTSNAQPPIATTSQHTNNPKNDKDWFEKAVVDCAELTEFLSSRITSLSELHMKANDDWSFSDLHKSFQSYLETALAKLAKIKRTMTANYEKETADMRVEELVNPFAKRREQREKSDNNSASEDSRDSFKASRTICVTTNSMKPEEILFDMDVTNASDEECVSPKTSRMTTPVPENKDDSDSDVQEVEFTKNNEIIQIIDSDDDEVVEKEIDESPVIPIAILNKIKSKFNLNGMSIEELLKHLSAVVITNKDTIESLQTISKKDRRNIQEKVINLIETLSKMQFVQTPNNPSSTNNNDTISTNNNSQDSEEECETVQDKTIDMLNSELDKTEHISDNEENNKHTDEERKDKTTDITENKELDKIGLISDNEETNTEKINDDAEKDITENKELPYKTNDECINNEKVNKTADISDSEKNKHTDDAENLAPTKTDSDLDDAQKKDTGTASEFIASKDMGDIEDILDSNIVLRSKNASSFGDEFSKFVTTQFDEPPDSSASLKDTLNIVQELDISPECVDDICTNRDNGSLSLPPDSITASDLIKLEKEENNQNEVLNNQNESDVILNSEILALQQLAENCVTSMDVHKSSAECKG